MAAVEVVDLGEAPEESVLMVWQVVCGGEPMPRNGTHMSSHNTLHPQQMYTTKTYGSEGLMRTGMKRGMNGSLTYAQ